MRRLIAAGTIAGLLVVTVLASTGRASGSSPRPRLVHLAIAIVSTDDGDRIVEGAELFSFTVEVRNIGDAPATGVSATLAPNGWTVQQGSSTYPDLAPGSTASNATPFSGLAISGCGQQMNATLNITTQQGAFSVPVVIPVSGVVAAASWTSTVPVDIPDMATVEAPLEVSGAGTGPIMDLNVRIGDLRYAWDEDLLIAIRLPGWAFSSAITLANRRGLGADFVNTLFDDEAVTPLEQGTPPFTGTFRPDSTVTLAAADGFQAAGTWRLRIRDYEPDFSGRLNSWGIDVMTVRCNQQPSAGFDWEPLEPAPGRTVTFQSNSTDPDGRIVSQAWDLDNDGAFDDGTATSAQRSFPEAGAYTVRIQAVDDGENSTIGTQEILVVRPRALRRVCRVPRVVGRTLRAARTSIRRAGCRVGRVRHARSRARRGRVIGQRPPPGARRSFGARVNLTVSRGRR